MKKQGRSELGKEKNSEPDEAQFPGSHAYDNWLRFIEGRPWQATFEARLYTDAHVLTDIVGLGPYSFFNTFASGASRDRSRGTPAVVLRMAWHPSEQRVGFSGSRDDFDHYHGGDHFDELAALASLILGRRFRAGPIDREFRPGRDPLGDPIYTSGKLVPSILPPETEPQIPRLPASCGLDALRQIETLPSLSATEVTELVKAARLYQQAIWVCDADPALSWLLLVSAVETAADLWLHTEEPPLSRFRDAQSELATSISEVAPELLEPVAVAFAKFTGATRKFREFLLKFYPAPPDRRPDLPFQLDYDRGSLSKAFNTIYGHRSKSLHGGTAFPLPMCSPPRLWPSSSGNGSFHEEVQPALATRSLGATWSAKSAPMLLHTFEHIARGALLNWWKSLSPME